ncbi:MAG TPA: S-layer homology domain-containing protein [Clostridiaceae bacterium]|nr:S-layer homology domain-containing protein [Clostridiaceae bacterium]
MKRMKKNTVCFIVAFCLLFIPTVTYAGYGDSGYESGVSSGTVPGKDTFEYQEVCFISGEPIVFKGTVKIKKSMRRDEIITTYTYNLKNVDRSATLTRSLSFTTEISEGENGQAAEKTVLSKQPTETIKIDNTTYRLTNYDFTSSRIVVPRPAVEYYAGNLWWKKTYQIGTSSNGGTVTVEATGEIYGYNQYWGNTEATILNCIIQSEEMKNGKLDKWGGTAKISRSATISQQFKYYENIPDQIGFSGGYEQTQYNNNILEYSCTMPEFDSKGVSTDIMKTVSGSMKLESSPDKVRLPVADLRHLRGHWAENDIKLLYGLGIFSGDGSDFNPQQYMTRADFVSAIVKAAREVPEDPNLVKRTTSGTVRKKGSEEQVTSPFTDVSTKSLYFEDINNAFKRGLINGEGGKFRPNDSISVAEAITIFIRTVGLENLYPGPGAVTTFRDNDDIPGYAREAVYIAQKIGLIQGDERGYLKPNEKITKGRAAALISRFITYMGEGIKKDYREGILNY